jgi:hypothetical protein
MNVVASVNAIKQVVPSANVDAQQKEKYDEVQQHTIAKNKAKFALTFGVDWK